MEKYYGSPEVSLEVPQLYAMLSMEDEWSPISSKTSRQILKMHLLPLLSRVATFQDRNQMTAENLAVCFAPSLLCGPYPIEDLKMSVIVRRILVAMIVHWENDLAPLFDISFEMFEDSLRVPEAAEDREDPLEEAQTKDLDETQSVGITLLDNDDSDDEMEIQPALPPRPRVATVSGGTIEEPNAFDIGITSRTNPVNSGLSNGISPVRRKPSPFDNAPLKGMSHIDNGAFTATGPSDPGLSNSGNPVRRKPAPALLPLPQYSAIVSDSPATLRGIQYYNTVPIEDDDFEDDDSGDGHGMNDADGLPLYEERVPIYNEPTGPPPCPPPESQPTRPPPSPPPAAEPSIQRKPLPKPATWG